MVRSRLRSLERQLVFERAEEVVTSEVDHLLLEWEMAQSHSRRLPDPFEFVSRIIDAGFYLPTNAKVVNYLLKCDREGKVPDRRILLQLLLPWSW